MKYFITSDLHSFCSPLKKALNNAGYDINNDDHILVILGDLFDRGTETRALYNFLRIIPKNRLYLVKGNHEYLFEGLLKKDLPDDFDFGNGTVRTCCQLAYSSANIASKNEYILKENIEACQYQILWKAFDGSNQQYSETYNYVKRRWKDIVRRAKKSWIYKWYIESEWHNYWEFKNFVGVHSFVPVKTNANASIMYDKILNAVYYGQTDWFDPDPDWRKSDSKSWEFATWGCPYVFMDADMFTEKSTKTLICGHYRADAFHQHYEEKTGDHDIYYSKDIVAIDSTVAWSKQTNILIINENGDCFDQYGNKLN